MGRKRVAQSRFPFTIKRLEELPPPPFGREYHYDSQQPGLACCVTAAGGKTYYLYRKIDGRPERIRLGAFPAVSIDAARKAVREIVGEIAAGRDPAEERRARREVPTIGDLFNHWLAHAKERKRTWSEDERQYESFLKRWSGRKLSAVKRGDVQKLHSEVGETHGHYAANRMLALVRAMFNKAPELGWDGPNPATGVARFAEETRDRFLQPDEFHRFFEALEQEPNTTARDFILLALWTGARRSNVAEMRWEDVSFDLALWRIPQTKSGEPVVVPLVEPALEILRARRRFANGSPWVFPSNGKTGHLVEPKSAWKRVLERSGLHDLRLHDLRRTLGSWQALSGASLQTIAKTLGHKSTAVTHVYSRLTVAAVRASVETATAAMIQAGKQEGSNDGHDK
jgi:integrase